ncbi:hypothetical protein [Jongsikchunia kroppenstedtii]|uniref:hypothetical protein n=1 Tax=Jongsikchunia kroppenstedtii TaxID=1121721 RepID=UPI0003676F00|nr:hypothetical protein [Jongsikchunia kroppenstedtii]
MSLEELVSLVPPPKAVPHYDFDAAQAAVGFVLPDDYKQLVGTYGEGSLGGYLGLMAPTPDDLIAGGAYCRQSLTDLRGTYGHHQWIHPDGSTVPMAIEDVDPVPYYGWGGAPGGETGYWHMTGDDPNAWAAVVIGDGLTNDYHPGGLVAYLADLVAGRFPTQVFGDDALELIRDGFVPRPA